MSLTVALIRPGSTLYDEQNRVQGVLDIPLSARGIAEAEALAKQLVVAPIEALYCGPGASVTQTAQFIGQSLGLRPRCLESLHNLDQGLWQGLQYDEIRRRNIKLYRQWLDDPWTICPPHGETIQTALERVRETLRPVLRRHRNQELALVVGHPLAEIISAYLRRESELHLEEEHPTGHVERIVVPTDFERNGQH
jgi:broad specificity phosphatase PhoE